MTEPKIMVLSAVHGMGGDRKEVCEFFSRRMQTVRKETGIETLIVGSEGELSRKVAEDYGHYYVEFPNRPLSRKFNAGLHEIKKHNPDYVMILGSDDIASDSFFEASLALSYDNRFGVIGVHDIYFMGLNEKRWGFGYCGYWQGRSTSAMLGVGRMVHRDILDFCNWRLWSDARNAGMDAGASLTIKKAMAAGINPSSCTFGLKKHGHMIVDIKTRGNISSMSNFQMDDIDYRTLFEDHLPHEEASDLIEYCNSKIALHEST